MAEVGTLQRETFIERKDSAQYSDFSHSLGNLPPRRSLHSFDLATLAEATGHSGQSAHVIRVRRVERVAQ